MIAALGGGAARTRSEQRRTSRSRRGWGCGPRGGVEGSGEAWRGLPGQPGPRGPAQARERRAEEGRGAFLALYSANGALAAAGPPNRRGAPARPGPPPLGLPPGRREASGHPSQRHGPPAPRGAEAVTAARTGGSMRNVQSTLARTFLIMTVGRPLASMAFRSASLGAKAAFRSSFAAPVPRVHARPAMSMSSGAPDVPQVRARLLPVRAETAQGDPPAAPAAPAASAHR